MGKINLRTGLLRNLEMTGKFLAIIKGQGFDLSDGFEQSGRLLDNPSGLFFGQCS